VSDPAVPVYLLKGDDPVVLRDAVRELVHRLVGEGDASLMVEEVGEAQHRAGGDGPGDLGALVAAAQTPPFLTDRRVVVGRDLGDLTKAEHVAPLVAYLADPLPTTVLVLEWSAGRIPKSLVEAVVSAGGAQVDTSPGRKLGDWVDTHLRDAGLHLDAAARSRVTDWLGENASRLMSLIETLSGSFPSGARLGVDDVEPYLGEEGGVPPWELTDAIDAGDIAVALHKLDRVLAGGGRHPLAVMAILHGHYSRMLRLDGADVTGEKDAAALLGMRGSTFPARKALNQARRLGHARVVRAIELLAQADLDLRGMKAWPDDLVMEVLVARLTRLARS
jgi:DNA polymerase-3 subunit delta